MGNDRSKKSKKSKKKETGLISSAAQPAASMDHARNDEFAGEYKDKPRRTAYINVGDRVIMTDAYEVPNEYKGVIWTVTAGPKYVSGTRVVWLEGYKGCYAVDGLQVVG